MKQTAVVIAPGRGTYGAAELGYLARHHAGGGNLVDALDDLRRSNGQPTITELDSAARFEPKIHLRSDNASLLIHACALADFQAIDRERFDIVGITGNSMGWYIALTCGGALSVANGAHLINTMGGLMQDHGTGGQSLYPVTDADWQPSEARRAELAAVIGQIDARAEHALSLSIDLGGFWVVAGNTAGLRAFEAAMPKLDDRYPMRLPQHAAFHSPLMADISRRARVELSGEIFGQPKVPLIDGRGFTWSPRSTDTHAIWDYTLGHQLTATYDFQAALRMAALNLMPDVFIILGPGTTLGGATAQSLIRHNWRGWTDKAGFQAAQKDAPRLLAMGVDSQRRLVTGEIG